MPTVTRELSIAYGTLTTGGSTDYLIDGPYEIFKDYETARVVWRVVVAAATENAFATACAAVEAAMRTINVALTVTLGSETLLSLSHSSGTGYLSRGSARVLEEIQTGRSRRYELSVTARTPADATGKSLLRSAAFRVVRSPSGVRTLQANGVYTCNGATGARATYAANVATLIGTITTALTGTWERTGDSEVTFDDEDKEARWSEVYQELIFNQASGVLNNAALVGARFSVALSREAPGDAQGASRLRTAVVTFASAVDTSQSTDLTGLYTGTVRPYLISEAARVAESSAFALVSDEPTIDPFGNSIAARIVVLCYGDSDVIQAQVTTRDIEETGVVLVPVHGGKFERLKFDGPALRVRIVSRDETRIGGTSSSAGGRSSGGSGLSISDAVGALFGGTGKGIADQFGVFGFAEIIGPGNYLGGIDVDDSVAGGGGGSSGGAPGGASFAAGYFKLRDDLTKTPQVIGLAEMQGQVTVTSMTTFYEYAEPVTRRGGGGGGGRVFTPGGTGQSGNPTAPK